MTEKIAAKSGGSNRATTGSEAPAQPSDSPAVLASLGSLTWPILGGLGLSAVFYGALHAGLLNLPGGYGEFIQRYFAGHWVLYIETILFFIGVAALLLKTADIASQSSLVRQLSLKHAPRKLEKTEDAAAILAWLHSLPVRVRQSYIGKRFIDSLTHVDRCRDANRLDEELKYLSDLDAIRQQESYGLVKILIWATPMLGFLGTVIGITMALATLASGDGISGGIGGLLGGLGVAFDTTALALSLSIALMFAQFLLQQVESQLLTAVDLKANEELVGRFESAGGSNDPLAASLRRMGQLVMQSCDDLVKRQAELWQATVDASNRKWQTLTEDAGSHLQTALAKALTEALAEHAHALGQSEQSAAAAWREEAQAWRIALEHQARLVGEQQHEMTRQGETLTRAVEAVGEVTRLETALNRNLETLASAKHFEETSMSLAAAVQLLSARVGSSDSAGRVQLQPPKQGERAA